MSDQKQNVDLTYQMVDVQNKVERILGHHVKFDKMIETLLAKLDSVSAMVTKEREDRILSIAEIKDNQHQSEKKIMMSILGGAAMFVSGIIMWLVESIRR